MEGFQFFQFKILLQWNPLGLECDDLSLTNQLFEVGTSRREESEVKYKLD